MLIRDCAYPHIRIYTYKLLILMHIFAFTLIRAKSRTLAFQCC
ncbi:hypothetical protein HMPREF1580_00694 [Gardnerella vaginalis JCP8070]|nr:hypothetical protein HMPREF1580_00694 [Gardnerella vaginalis JCP8070]